MLTMKLSLILLSIFALSLARSTNEDLLQRAAAQLDRLSTFRRSQEVNREILEHPLDTRKSLSTIENSSERIESTQSFLIDGDAMKRIDELASTAYNLYNDPNYREVMQERIKRSGSGDFISGIAGKVINGVVGVAGGLSSGLSGGSSGPQQTYDSYGTPVQPYEAKSFSLWDIKKAILNTLIQAFKAIAGGAIAVKGHLIKGGGFLVQTTGRVISSAGEAASSLGSQIAGSAIIGQASPSTGYSYNAPTGQDFSYDGPPPSQDGPYTQHNVYHHYGGASDDEIPKEPGLLVIEPTKPEDNNHHHKETNNQSDGQPSVSTLEESFGGSPKGTKSITKLVGLVSGASGPPTTHQYNDHVSYLPVEHKEQTASSYQQHSQHVPNQTPENQNNHEHHQQQHQHSELQSSPIQQENLQEIPIQQQNQLAYQQIWSLISPHLGVPINAAQNFKEPISNYGLDAANYESLKIPIIDNHNSLESFNQGNYGLPSGYGIPMHHGLEMDPNFSNWKRSAMNLRQRKKGLNKFQVHRAIDYWIKGAKLHRI